MSKPRNGVVSVNYSKKSAPAESAPKGRVEPQGGRPLRTMDQDRAEFALAQIEAVALGDKPRQAAVRRHIPDLPAMIRTNGLGQALAFYRMKKKEDGYEQIYRMVSDWLCGESSRGRVFDEDGDALRAITQSDMFKYMAAQNEALALLEWLKKFALALLEKGDEQ